MLEWRGPRAKRANEASEASNTDKTSDMDEASEKDESMTVETTGGGAVQPTDWSTFAADLDLDDGLADISGSDLALPRLSIVHKHATFKDSVTKNEFTTLNAVFLGVIKQRVMWDNEVEDGDKPQCKSPDFETGFPQMRTDIDEDKQFPWADSNFLKVNFTPNDAGRIELPCETCSFQQWTRKGAKSVKPRCSEQFTMPLYYFLEDDPSAYPAIISFQRTGAKPARTFAGSFKAQRQPMFTVMSTVTLTAESRGSVEYCTPDFRRGAQTSPDRWREYSEMYRGIRDMLRQPPRGEDDDKDDKGGKDAPAASNGASANGAAATPPARKPPSAAAATAIKEDDPWASKPAEPTGSDLPF